MTIQSMTGFARSEGTCDFHAWAWEIKSVNGKGFDMRCRLPFGFDALEQRVRAAAARYFKRGNLSATLTLSAISSASSIRLNDELLDHVAAMLAEVRQRLPDVAPPTADGVLALRGMIDAQDERQVPEQREVIEAAVLDGLESALQQLIEGRRQEGTRLAAVLGTVIDEIATLVTHGTTLAAAQPAALAERLRAQVEDLLTASPPLSEERLNQEVALLITKADVREELDRLGAHVAAARQLLEQSGPLGRRLDFLCQEFNREANTLCAKASDLELTRVGLDLKNAIDQLREQVQNIE